MNQGSPDSQPPFWSIAAAVLLNKLQSRTGGLTTGEAQNRLKTYGANRLKPKTKSDTFTLLTGQFKSPIILILLFATMLSLLLHNPVEASIILIIVGISGGLGFWQEYSASNAVAKLLDIVKVNAAVLRDGKPVEMPLEDIVPGDIVILNARETM